MNHEQKDAIHEPFDERAKRLGYTREQCLEHALSMIGGYAREHGLSHDAVVTYFEIGISASLNVLDLKPEAHGNMESRRYIPPDVLKKLNGQEAA